MAIPVLEDWKILKNGSIYGTVKGHPAADIDDGDTITTSPLKDPERAASKAVVNTVTGSKYRLGLSLAEKNGKAAPAKKQPAVTKQAPAPKKQPTKQEFLPQKQASPQKTKEQIDKERKMKAEYKLNGNVIGDYLLSGTPIRSTSGKSNIWTAYRADKDGLPTGEPLAIKTSANREKLEGEYLNYKKVGGRGRFVKMMEFLPVAGDSTQFSSLAALVVEKGSVNLRDYLKEKRVGLKGKALRDAASAAAQCVQAVHSSRMVWTDLKPENFVLMGDSGGGIDIRGIDLESVCNVKENPVDYSPESCPPEFARDLMRGEGPYFVLEYSYDIWSYGIMLYELATATSPFGRKTASQISQLLNSPGYEFDLTPIEDPRLKDLISQCLQIDPNRRPSITQILLHPYFLTTGIGPFSF